MCVSAAPVRGNPTQPLSAPLQAQQEQKQQEQKHKGDQIKSSIVLVS